MENCNWIIRLGVFGARDPLFERGREPQPWPLIRFFCARDPLFERGRELALLSIHHLTARETLSLRGDWNEAGSTLDFVEARETLCLGGDWNGSGRMSRSIRVRETLCLGGDWNSDKAVT